MDPLSRERWEWSPEQIRQVGHRVIDLIADHLSELPDQPVFRPFPNERARAMLDEPLPHDGAEADAILDRFAAEILPYPLGNGHPRFFGWVNGPPVVLGVLAEALAAAMNPSVAGGNHAATYVERQALEWLKQLVGLDRDAMGLLVSGGSAATLIGLAAARHHATGGAVRRQGVDGRLVVYASDQGHSAIAKAVELLGLGSERLRVLPSTADWRLDPAALGTAIDRDRAEGLVPMAVAASAGTVNTGAIDPLAELAELCREQGVWLHVDGAYGAPGILHAGYRAELEPLARADSVALDAHKWLNVPYDAGAVFVRDAELMRDAFSLVPPYLREHADPDGVTWLPWLSEYGLEQTRAFRALKLWMSLAYHGRAGYTASIGRDVAHAQRLAELVVAHPALELVAHNLSIVCLRCVPAGVPEDELNALNERILRELQLGGEAFLSGTTLDGRFVLRACFVNPRTREQDVDRLVAAVARLSPPATGSPPAPSGR
jgi:aromatic-L-amino-acid/L-tryptophan decarboxylase